VDFNLFGHQVVAHLVDGYQAARSHNQVDGDPVPVPHFGLALSLQQFDALARRCRQQGVRFVIEPHLRFQGACGAPSPRRQLAFAPPPGWLGSSHRQR
jgi:extradiol dioxygenase family protein